MMRERWIEAYAEMLASRDVDAAQDQVAWAQAQYERALESAERQEEGVKV